ncbi:Uncharacterized protein TCM_018912 [Theobroma cacao]|uniref:RNase H type-1 domain-containing protein n=1 Tax=Theobroma cacao TaxID=3641 RepID=A0A061EH77_THECC|nr:Uncharacterized protein TCM_018912 [Theobroma cacao]
MDGATKGSLGEARIEGVLRDSNSEVKILFVKFIGIVDPRIAKLMAIRKALLIFSTSKWNLTYGLDIESDSINAIKWLKFWVDTPDDFVEMWAMVLSMVGCILGFSLM